MVWSKGHHSQWKTLTPATLDNIHILQDLTLLVMDSCYALAMKIILLPCSNSEKNNGFKCFSLCSLKQCKSTSSFHGIKSLLFFVTGLTYANLILSPLLFEFIPRTIAFLESLTKWAMNHLFCLLFYASPSAWGAPKHSPDNIFQSSFFQQSSGKHHGNQIYSMMLSKASVQQVLWQ